MTGFLCYVTNGLLLCALCVYLLRLKKQKRDRENGNARL